MTDQKLKRVHSNGVLATIHQFSSDPRVIGFFGRAEEAGFHEPATDTSKGEFLGRSIEEAKKRSDEILSERYGHTCNSDCQPWGSL